MFKKISNFIVFFIFLGAFGILLFFNYKSYTSTNKLIENNDELIEELELSSNIQFFQTHLVLLDKYINESIASGETSTLGEVERELKILKLSSNYLNTMFSKHRTGVAGIEFDRLVTKKLTLGQRLLDEYKISRNVSGELSAEARKSAEINDLLNEKLFELEEVNEDKVIEKSEWIKRAENNTQQLNLIFMLVSSLLFVIALVYIYNKIKNQQNLIIELEYAKKKEIKLNKIKDDFIANMSHEIRTPLNVILGFSSLMEKEKLSDKVSDMVQTLKNAGGQLMMIVNQILDIAKMEEGKLQVDAKPFQLSQLCDIIDSSYRKIIEENGVQFEVIYNSVNEKTTLVGDQMKIMQIVSNLLSNAHKFTTKGKISLRVNLMENETSTSLELVVSDTGIGIAYEKLKTIFDRFEQADNDITRNYGGTGLGLAIVKQLVDLLEGKIHVTSSIGHGTTFTVLLPVVIQKTKMELQESNSQDHEIVPGTKILVVEDNSLNTKLLQNWLAPFKLEVNYTETAIEAIELLKQHSFDIVLMDIQMPGMDGYTCARHIRNELGLKTPIIGMTAHTRKQDMLKCYDSGMQGYLSKPIDPSEFFNLLSYYSLFSRTQLINKEYLTKLSGGNNLFLNELLQEFLKQTPIEDEKLRLAFFNEDLNAIKTAAHNLKTNYGYLGLDAQVIQLFQSIEYWKDIPANYNAYFLVEYLLEKVKGEVGESVGKLFCKLCFVLWLVRLANVYDYEALALVLSIDSLIAESLEEDSAKHQ